MKIDLSIGKLVVYKDHTFTIIATSDMNNVIGRKFDSNETRQLPISELNSPWPEEKRQFSTPKDIMDIPSDDWEKACFRFEVIKPILEISAYKRAEKIQVAALENKVSEQTIYRWLKFYEKEDSILGLLKKKRVDKGKSALPNRVNMLIDEVIDNYYLTTQRISVKTLWRKLKEKCDAEQINTPHENTIRNRIKNLPEIVKAKRLGKSAVEKHTPIRGNFPGAEWPLANVQIDHTPLDIILVDEIYRQPIGRPNLTLATDVYSRMVTGFYLSFDPPNAFSTGMCISQSVLPKDDWLAKFDIKGSWPVSGVMDTIHMDNAKEFRGNMLRRACLKYGIDIQWRPVATPRYGGHVERIFETITNGVHELPGSTFSNSQMKGEYKSEKKATMTLKEMDQWLTTLIVNVYHNDYHSQINMSPLDKYEQGILGDDIIIGRGLPPRVKDEDEFKITLLPYEERSIQRYGVVINHIFYYQDVLRKWIGKKEPNNTRHKMKFIFRYDPRDISAVYFFDPELNEHFRIPYRDTSHPSISIWEFRNIRKKLIENGKKNINESDIFDAYSHMEDIVSSAQKETKSTRRNTQKRLDTRRKPLGINIQTDFDNILPTPSFHEESNISSLKPFTDIEG